jgi:large subunit ribosomal protein L17
MRHLKRNTKFGRNGEHRNAMLTNLAASIIKHRRVTTTVTKAKVVRQVIEKLITLGRHAIGASPERNVHLRRLAAGRLRQQPRSLFRGTPTVRGKASREAWREQNDVVHILFDKIAPQFKDRAGGYTRIVKLGQRQGDSAQLAIIELVEAGSTASSTASGPAPIEGAAPASAS